jgi:hypothetical protein
MRTIIFGALLAAATLAGIGGVSTANAMSQQSAPAQAGPANPLVQNVYWVRTFYYRPFVYVPVCGWVATPYGPARVCN